MKKRVTDAENFRTRSTVVQQEFDDAAQFFQDVGLRGVFLFFGSARSRSMAQIDEARKDIIAKIDAAPSAEARSKLEKQLHSWKAKEWMAPVWDATAQLAKLLTEWSVSAEGVEVGNQVWSLLPGGNENQPLQVCTGGGPGFMEAAQYGCDQIAGAKSIGVAVKLPFETELNPYVPEGHGITVNSFYARKYWEVYAIKAMICCPGGFGTLDEMFEVLTLVQCGHCPRIPVVLLGKEFWTNAVNFKFLADREVIAKDDVDQLCITDSPEEAFQFIIEGLREEAARMASMPSSPQVKKLDESASHGGASVGKFTAEDDDGSRSDPPQIPPFRRDREEKKQDGNVVKGSALTTDAAKQ